MTKKNILAEALFVHKTLGDDGLLEWYAALKDEEREELFAIFSDMKQSIVLFIENLYDILSKQKGGDMSNE